MKKFDIREFLKNTKIELGEYKTTIEDKAFKGYNDLRRDNHEVIITEGGKLNLHTRKEVTVNKSDMKVVSKKEWDRANKDYKGIRNGQPYMLYFDEETQSTVYGPVYIKK